jgi:hypothetical protein
MDWSDLMDLLEEDEGPNLEFKESQFLENKDEIAAQIVSFANRHGGTILVGVRDDKTIEGAKIDKDKEQLKIINIAQNKCSPIVEVSFDHMSSSEGEVLLIKVPRRRDMPHAIAHRTSAEIEKRTYYIRSGNSKRLVDDNVLRFMFKHTEDPNVSISSTLCMWYNRSSFDFSISKSLRYVCYFLPFLESLNAKDVQHLSSDESNSILDLLLAIFPYAFLSYLSSIFSSSWLVSKEERSGGGVVISPLKGELPSEIIRVTDITNVNTSNILSKLSADTNYILNMSLHEFRLPKATKITIEFKGENPIYESCIKLKTHPLI